MNTDLRDEYAKIGQERDAEGRIHDRERFWFWVRVGLACWGWTIVGGIIMANAFHINAVAGPFYFPDAMDRARLWMQSGMLVGSAGSFATLIWAWRTASKRGYFD